MWIEFEKTDGKVITINMDKVKYYKTEEEGITRLWFYSDSFMDVNALAADIDIALGKQFKICE